MTPSSDRVNRWPHSGHPQSRLAGAAALTAITVVAGHVYASASPAGAVKPPTTFGALAPLGLQDQLDAANAELERTAAAITESKRALAEAAARLPLLQVELAQANSRASQAALTQQQAAAAVTSAQTQVLAGQQQLEQVRGQIATLQVEVGRLVRQAYITGGESEQLAVLMQAQDPADFLRQLQWLARVSRGNNKALDAMSTAQQALASRLHELSQLEAMTRQREDDAAAAATAAAAAVAQVQATTQQLTDVSNQRIVLLTRQKSDRAALTGAVARLIERQQQLAITRPPIPQQQSAPTKPPSPTTKPAKPAPASPP
ncbi:MAG: hypothetical protein WCI74_11715, partial [Actinomycetes bacterium]